MALRADDAMVLYNVACVFGQLGKKDEALDALRKDVAKLAGEEAAPQLARALRDSRATVRAAALIEIDPPIEQVVLHTAQEVLPDAGVRVWQDLAGLARCAEITVRSAPRPPA